MQSVEGLSHNTCPLSGNLLKLSLATLNRFPISEHCFVPWLKGALSRTHPGGG